MHCSRQVDLGFMIMTCRGRAFKPHVGCWQNKSLSATVLKWCVSQQTIQKAMAASSSSSLLYSSTLQTVYDTFNLHVSLPIRHLLINVKPPPRVSFCSTRVWNAWGVSSLRQFCEILPLCCCYFVKHPLFIKWRFLLFLLKSVFKVVKNYLEIVF